MHEFVGYCTARSERLKTRFAVHGSSWPVASNRSGIIVSPTRSACAHQTDNNDVFSPPLPVSNVPKLSPASRSGAPRRSGRFAGEIAGEQP